MTDAAPITAAPSPGPHRGLPRRWLWPGGLSARLLLLTALFVMLAELLILAPSLAAYVEGRLEERVRAAGSSGLARKRSIEAVMRCIGRTRKKFRDR